MCIMRCEVHQPKRAQRSYTRSVKPFGYPETALICGSAKCAAPALVWLENHEAESYDAGERIFMSFTATMKVRTA